MSKTPPRAGKRRPLAASLAVGLLKVHAMQVEALATLRRGVMATLRDRKR